MLDAKARSHKRVRRRALSGASRPVFAVILIGGQGTRLRPLTCAAPKPLLPLLNKPFLSYQFETLKKHGVRDVVLCTSYLAAEFRRAFGDGRALGLRLRFVHESHPLGTGGALKNAQSLLPEAGPILVLNGDVLHALDVSSFLRFHRGRRASASVALTRVKDPTRYGVVQTDESGRVRKFVEKPSWDEIESNTINAGAYLLEAPLLDLIPAGIASSLERSFFPLLLQTGRSFFGYVSRGYWIDIGTTDKYLQAHLDLLDGSVPFALPAGRRLPGFLLGPGARLGREIGRGRLAAVGAGARVADFARFSGRVCLGPRVRVGRGASLEDCVVLDGAVVGEGASLKRCVVGPRCRVGAQAFVGEGAVLAAGSELGDYSRISN